MKEINYEGGLAFVQDTPEARELLKRPKYPVTVWYVDEQGQEVWPALHRDLPVGASVSIISPPYCAVPGLEPDPKTHLIKEMKAEPLELVVVFRQPKPKWGKKQRFR